MTKQTPPMTNQPSNSAMIAPATSAAMTTNREAERAAVVTHIRRVIGSEATRLMLAAGLPGGTRTQRTRNAAFADGVAHAVKVIANAIERADHLKSTATAPHSDEAGSGGSRYRDDAGNAPVGGCGDLGESDAR